MSGEESRPELETSVSRDADNIRQARSRSRSRERNRQAASRFGNKSFTNSNDPHMKRARLFVGDLNTKSSDLRKRDVENLFTKYGRVCGISVHNGYAFVQMDRERNANKAIHFAHGKLINGHKIRVEFSSAALEAGAKFRPLSPEERDDMEEPHGSDLYSYRRDPLALLEIERMERERLERLLRLERELHSRGVDDLDKLYDTRRSDYGSSDYGSWRSSSYSRPRRDYSPPTYGGRGASRRDTRGRDPSPPPYRYGSPPSRYGDSDSLPVVGYHAVDKSSSGRDNYSYGGYGVRQGGRNDGPNIGYGHSTSSQTSYGGLMGNAPMWK